LHPGGAVLKFKITYSRTIVTLAHTLAAVFFVLLLYNVYHLVAVAMPIGERIAEGAVYILLNAVIVIMCLSAVYASRYVLGDGKLKVYGTGIFYTTLDVQSIYRIVNYRDAAETFLFFKHDGKDKTHFLCVNAHDAQELTAAILKQNPSAVFEIVRKEDLL